MDVIIEPDEGMRKEIAQQLLELAEHPSQVVWVQWPVAGFKVPVELSDRLRTARTVPATPVEQEAPRRRGRPRRQAEETVPDTDDTEKEE